MAQHPHKDDSPLRLSGAGSVWPRPRGFVAVMDVQPTRGWRYAVWTRPNRDEGVALTPNDPITLFSDVDELVVAIEFDYTEPGETPTDVRLIAVVDGLAITQRLGSDGKPRESSYRRVDNGPLADTEHRRVPFGAINRARESLLVSELIVERLGRAWGAERLTRPGRKGREALYYARFALLYVEALGRDAQRPIGWLLEPENRNEFDLIKDEPGLTEDKLRARVRRARRDLHLLTTPPEDGKAGKAGGVLMPDAIDLLVRGGDLTAEAEQAHRHAYELWTKTEGNTPDGKH